MGLIEPLYNVYIYHNIIYIYIYIINKYSPPSTPPGLRLNPDGVFVVLGSDYH